MIDQQENYKYNNIMKIPKYLKVSRDTLYINIEEWKKSPEREREIEHTEQLRRYLKK